MKPKIAFFDTKPYDKEYFNEINKTYHFDITYFRYHLTSENIILAKGFNIIIVFVNDIINEKMMEILADYGIKLIALRSSGFNNIDLKSALGKIKIVRVPAYSPNAIAEHTVALMLSLNRKIHRAYFRTRDANFSLHGLLGFDMYGKTAGVIGTGRIGKALIKILKGFDMKVIAFDKYPDANFAKDMKIDYVPLEEIFKKSDIISLNCPLTKETEYLINRNTISLMKKGVMIINTGRGKLIKTSDLIHALKSGKVGSAGLDVYEEESKFFFEDLSDRVLTDDILARLLTFNNVIITSHQGFFTREALYNIAHTTMQNIQDFIDNKPLVNEVCFNCP
jgi:D-lactate dehydrogenase